MAADALAVGLLHGKRSTLDTGYHWPHASHAQVNREPDSSCLFPVQRVWKQRRVCLMGEHGVLPVDVPWKAGGTRNVEAVYEHLPEFDAEQRGKGTSTPANGVTAGSPSACRA
jgi:hypothetical protein